jgi:formate dehydrogenase iron-sulfur subunit
VENRLRLQRAGKMPMESGVNQSLSHLNYIYPIQKEYGSYPNAYRITELKHCMHCENAPCASNCPANAIEKRPGGQVVINQDLCVGCRTCQEACPFDVPVYDAQSNTSFKCTMCYDRVESGLKPACVSSCISGALFSGSMDEVLAEAKKRAKFYSERFGMPYMVFGAEKVNDYVGQTGWITIASAEQAEKYGLPKDPVVGSMVMKNSLKAIGVGVTAAAAIGSAGHFLYWLSKRKEAVSSEKKED